MGTPVSHDFLEKLISNDHLGLLSMITLDKATVKNTYDYQSAQEAEIATFIEEHDRNPNPDSTDIDERRLGKRFEEINRRAKAENASESKPWYGALAQQMFAQIDENNSIFDFDGRPELAPKDKADHVAQHRRCMNFVDKYEERFKAVQQALDEGHRQIYPFTETSMAEGKYFIQNGLIILIDQIYELKKKARKNDTNKKDLFDGRTHCVYSNGTECEIMYQSLIRGLRKENGKCISDDDRENSFSSLLPKEQTSEDMETGYIYILQSLSKEPEVLKFNGQLFKIGFTTGTVESRIANAEKESTYLCSKVQILQKWKCLNLKASKLEDIIHKFFAPAQVPILVNDNGNSIIAKEWYSLPLPIIEKVVPLILDGSITQFRYEPSIQSIIHM